MIAGIKLEVSPTIWLRISLSYLEPHAYYILLQAHVHLATYIINQKIFSAFGLKKFDDGGDDYIYPGGFDGVEVLM